MVNRYTHGDLLWIDLESPTTEEVREVMKEHAISPAVADELLLPTLKPRIDIHGAYIYLVLHFPAFKHSHSVSENQEINFIICKDTLITTRYDTVDALHKFSKVFEVNSILDKSGYGNHAGFLFSYMVRKLYGGVEHELEYLDDQREEIEANIFAGREREMVFELSRISRHLLNFKQALLHHRDILESFQKAAPEFFGADFKHHAQAILGEYRRINNNIRAQSSSISELRETNNTLVSTKQNEIMKILTIMAFVTFPLSLVASIFGMNTRDLPLTGFPGDFWIIIGIMLALTFSFFIFFKFKKWL